MKNNLRLVFGILFVFAGALIVLQNLNVFTGDAGNIIWASLFAASGIFVFSLYLKRRENWWWLVISLMLFSMSIGNIAGLFSGLKSYSPLITLFGAAIGFIIFYLIDRNQWWAMIPGGILTALGINEALKITSPEIEVNGILYLGLGISFLLIFLVPTKEGRSNWAILPAAILLAIGLLSSFQQGNSVLNYAGPALLLLAGGVVLFYSTRKR
ncbi:hypothetical protein KQH54_03005 [bacterium]|nr:hypothetical protein [bacterium]